MNARATVLVTLLTATCGLFSFFALGWLAGAPMLFHMGEASNEPGEDLLTFILETGSPVLGVAVLAALYPLLRHSQAITEPPRVWSYRLCALTCLLYLGCWVWSVFSA